MIRWIMNMLSTIEGLALLMDRHEKLTKTVDQLKREMSETYRRVERWGESVKGYGDRLDGLTAGVKELGEKRQMRGMKDLTARVVWLEAQMKSLGFSESQEISREIKKVSGVEESQMPILEYQEIKPGVQLRHKTEAGVFVEGQPEDPKEA